ncbi:unnamed protein product, partial [Ixodes hexagonus]
MARLLGCRVHETNYESPQTTFEHLTRPTGAVQFIFDACLALKLLRNFLGHKKGLKSAAYGYKRLFNPANIQERSHTMERVGQNIMQLELPDDQPVVLYGRRVSVIAFAFTLKSVAGLASQLLSSGTVRLVQERN